MLLPLAGLPLAYAWLITGFRLAFRTADPYGSVFA